MLAAQQQPGPCRSCDFAVIDWMFRFCGVASKLFVDRIPHTKRDVSMFPYYEDEEDEDHCSIASQAKTDHQLEEELLSHLTLGERAL